MTAGDSSSLNDGASALLIGDDSLPGPSLARIVSRGTHALDPDILGFAPVEATNKASAWRGRDIDARGVADGRSAGRRSRSRVLSRRREPRDRPRCKELTQGIAPVSRARAV